MAQTEQFKVMSGFAKAINQKNNQLKQVYHIITSMNKQIETLQTRIRKTEQEGQLIAFDSAKTELQGLESKYNELWDHADKVKIDMHYLKDMALMFL